MYVRFILDNNQYKQKKLIVKKKDGGRGVVEEWDERRTKNEIPQDTAGYHLLSVAGGLIPEGLGGRAGPPVRCVCVCVCVCVCLVCVVYI